MTKGNRESFLGNSLAVQWLGLWTSPAGAMGSVPSGGTKIPHATQQTDKKKKKRKNIKNLGFKISFKLFLTVE